MGYLHTGEVTGEVVGKARRLNEIAQARGQSMAEMALAFDPIIPHIEQVAQDWSNGVDHGGNWPAKIVSAKYHAVEACWRIVDRAMEVSGGAGMFRANELERLFRDARCGRFHPANTFLTHEIVGKTALGIDLGEQPRWG